jgi:hypothetical protein
MALAHRLSAPLLALAHLPLAQHSYASDHVSPAVYGLFRSTRHSASVSERTKANQEQYELFLREVLDTYGPRDGDDAEQGDGGSVVRVNAKSEESYIDFKVGGHPHLPRAVQLQDQRQVTR